MCLFSCYKLFFLFHCVHHWPALSLGIKTHESQHKEENLLCPYLRKTGVCIRACSLNRITKSTFKFLCVFGVGGGGGNGLLIHKQEKKVVLAIASLDGISLGFILETEQRNSW